MASAMWTIRGGKLALARAAVASALNGAACELLVATADAQLLLVGDLVCAGGEVRAAMGNTPDGRLTCDDRRS